MKRSHVIVSGVEGGFAEEDFATLVVEHESAACPCNEELFLNMGVSQESGEVCSLGLALVRARLAICCSIVDSRYKTDVGTLEIIHWMMGGWSTHCMRRG